MTKASKFVSIRRFLLAMIFLMPALSFAEIPAGVVLVVVGNVKAIASDGSARELTRRSPVFSGDRVVTGASARVQVKFTDGSIMAFKPNSEMHIDQYAYEPQGVQAMFMSLVKGGFRTVSGAIGKRDRKEYKITTPVATVGIRGTVHEADFDPSSGLALGVWDGSTETCSSGGCMTLGADSEFRFGFVGLDGKGEGRTTPPGRVGSDGDMPAAGDDSDSGSETGDTGDDAGSADVADSSEGLFIGNADEFIESNTPPASGLAGFAAVGDAVVSPLPWGTASILPIDDAGVEFATQGPLTFVGNGTVNLWWFHSPIAGGYVNSGNTGAGGFTGAMPTQMLTPKGDELYWGNWTGAPSVSGGDVSFGTEAAVANDVVIPAAGVFMFGTASSSADISAALSGHASFHLLNNPINSLNTPFLIVDTTGMPQQITNGAADLMIDVAACTASGLITFSSNAGFWHLDLTGTLAQQTLSLSLNSGADGTITGSYYQPIDTTSSAALALGGNLQTRFVGSGAYFGVIGSFDVNTTSSSDNNYARGVLAWSLDPVVVPPTTSQTLSGYGIARDTAVSYPWGSNAVSVFRLSGTLAMNQALPTGYTFTSVDMGGNSLVSGCQDCVSAGTLTKPALAPMLQDIPNDTGAQVAWGQWDGNDVSYVTTSSSTAVTDPGVWIAGTLASTTVIQSSLSGMVDFSLLANFPYFIDHVSGTPEIASTAGGLMRVDVGRGTVDGFMTFDTKSLDTWNLKFSGSLINSQLALSVLTDLLTPTNASYLISNSAQAVLPVNGFLDMDFVGVNTVDGVLGSFDLQTVDTQDANYARGVYAYSKTLPSQITLGAVMLGNPVSTAYPWGDTNPVLTVGGVSLTKDALQNIVDASLLTSVPLTPYISRGCLACNSGVDAVPPPVPNVVHGTNDTNLNVIWGHWAGNDVSLGLNSSVATTAPVDVAGVYVVGSYPILTAPLTGSLSFGQVTGLEALNLASGVAVVDTPTLASGNMNVNADTGAVSGSLSFQNAAADAWFLSYTGTLAMADLGLLVSAGQVDQVTGAITSGSYFQPSGGQPALAVDGAMNGNLWGSSQFIEGAVGTFDVSTVSTSDPNATRGVFVMQPAN